MTVYRIKYTAKDETFRNFTFESNRRMVRNANFMTNPLFNDVLGEIQKRSNDPKNPMCKHGGCKKIRMIENLRTGDIIVCDNWIF